MNSPDTHLWLYGKPDDAFMYDRRRKCRNSAGHWFSYEIDDLAWIRQYACGQCPVFEQCARYGFAHPEEAGIFAGYSEAERHAIATGKRAFHDWRRNWSTSKYVSIVAKVIERRERIRRREAS